MAWRALLPQAALALIAIAGDVAPAHAHDEYDWIRRGGYVGVDGTRCCGKDDCHEVPATRIERTPQGYRLPDYDLIVPYRQTQTSEDGKYWLCRDHKTMRCFFAPPPAS